MSHPTVDRTSEGRGQATELGRADTHRTHRALADYIIAGLDTTYDLVYVDRGDQLTGEQVAALVRADFDALWSATEEWESDNRWDSVKQIIADAAGDVVARWQHADESDYDELRRGFPHTDEWESVRAELEVRDRSDWPRQLAAQTPAVLLRIAALDEDHAFSFEPVDAAQVLGRLGVPDDAHNRATVGYALDNASPEFSVLMGYWIVGADVEALYGLPVEGDTVIEIENPHLYLGNPFAGSGFITEEPLHATIRVKREDLRTDNDAFGYSVNSIYGGLRPSSFPATIRVPSAQLSPRHLGRWLKKGVDIPRQVR